MSWSRLARSSTKSASFRATSVALAAGALALLGSPSRERGSYEPGLRQFHSVDYSMSAAVPTYAVFSNQTDVRQYLGASKHQNISHELQQTQTQDHILHLCSQESAGESTRLVLITGIDRSAGGHTASFVEDILMTPPAAAAPESRFSWVSNLLLR